MSLNQHIDKFFGAVFAGPSYNFFPVTYDSTIADTVLHDTLSNAVNQDEPAWIDIR